ncbi:hypothetical protein A374_08479 [Fictibacillus macauensis ZFHKF-1]|uniref:Uncharacterized protein n=1 Tax=Fictibacillus macauensis ZFHKF-1 TaxID=1196324 RepID=I8AJ90_9BACL|nr:hypothetical protein [Fictibacillus macauensis]EIT85857.1 hypothetical protein A374_08479 [Fictibacillus macauensis ZFHKF-1]
MPALIIVILAPILLILFNLLTLAFCSQKEIPTEAQPFFFRMINICVTLLLISAYVENVFTH